MSDWSTGSIILFWVITALLVIFGIFVNLMIHFYPEAKREYEESQVEKSEQVEKYLPPSVKEDGTVTFTHSSNEVVGMMDGNKIFAFLKDDHDFYWIYEGIHSNPSEYVQHPTDPAVRIFIGKIMYRAVIDYEE